MIARKITFKIIFFILAQIVAVSILGRTPLLAREEGRFSSGTLSPRLTISSSQFESYYRDRVLSAQKIEQLFGSLSVEQLANLDFVRHEFKRLDKLQPGDIERSLGHIYTVGSHSRNALRALDEIPEVKPGNSLLTAYKSVETSGKMWLLRFAVLFHDIGKGTARDSDLMHPDKGANKILAFLNDENISLGKSDVQLLRWLILMHHHMNFFISKRDPYDEDTVIEFLYFLERFSQPEAKLAVNMLYLLSYADAVGVNMDHPTPGYQKTTQFLPPFYNAVMGYLDRHDLSRMRDDTNLRGQKKQWLESILPKEDDAVLETYLDMTPASIIAPHRKKNIKKQIELLKNATTVPQITIVGTIGEDSRPMFEITVAMKNHNSIGLLSRLSAIFYLNGLDIRRAEINTTDDGVVFDRFMVRNGSGPTDREAINLLSENLNRDIDRVFKQGLSVEKLFAVSGKPYAFPLVKHPFYRIRTQIDLNANTEKNETVMKLRTNDRLGLVHLISRVLYKKFGINIKSVILRTEGYQAVDTFQLDRDGKALSADTARAVKDYLSQMLDNKEEQPFVATQEEILSGQQSLNAFPGIGLSVRQTAAAI